MIAPHLSTEITIANLVQILVPGQRTIRAQNYCPDTYFWCGEPYEYCNFEISGISRQLDLANTGSSVTIGNAGQYDALRPIRDLLKAGNGWRQAKIRIITIYPNDPNGTPIIRRAQVLSSSIQGASINLSLKNPIEAINARVPSSIITNQSVPELPRSGGRG
jgi:hypothetical protein